MEPAVVTGVARFAIVAVAGAAIALMGVLLGAWWTPFVAGIAIGALLPRARWAVVAGMAAGLFAWAVPLETAQLQYGLKATSLSLAAIMGFNGAATVPLALTLVVGLLLGLTGAWLGGAARAFLPARAATTRGAPPAPAKAAPKPASRVPAVPASREGSSGT